MTTPADKVYEDRIRRMTARRGLALRKSRTRTPGALDYGRYWLVDARRNFIVGDRNGGDLEANVAWLQEDK
jgi:hypothetical protein